MTISDFLMGNLSPQLSLLCFVRILIAAACGMLIGLERGKRFKGAGPRTHIIVCCAAAMFMIVSKYGFADLAMPDNTFFNGTRGADPARIAAQVVSGISFLGAGVIYRNTGVVRGLTTAAGIWATASIGIAIGSGLIGLGVVFTLIITISQVIMHNHSIGADAYKTIHLEFAVYNGHDFYDAVMKQFDEWDVKVVESRVTRLEEGTTDYDFLVQRVSEISYSEMKKFIETREEIISTTNSTVH